MIRFISALVIVAALSACKVEGDEVADTPGTPTPEVTDVAPTAPATVSESSANGARAVAEETDDFLFEFAYPRQAGAIPELAALLDSQLDERRRELETEAANARREARDNGFPYNKHSYAAEWKVVADLPGWLSLSSEFATYTGGAHGMYGVTSLVWDKEQGKALKGVELFTSPAALEQALGKRFCDQLDRERERRRGPAADEAAANGEGIAAINSFVDCPDISELEVLVGSSNGRTFNRLTLYAGPYVAGPYVEGAYEVNLSVDRAVLDAVKPEYRESFTARN